MMKKLSFIIAVLGTLTAGSSTAVGTATCKNPLDCAPPIQIRDCPAGTPWSTDDRRTSYCEISAIAPAMPGYDLNSSTNITPIRVPVTRTYTPGAEPIVNPPPPDVPVAVVTPIPEPTAPAPVASVIGTTSGVIQMTPERLAAWEAANAAAAAAAAATTTSGTTTGGTATAPTGSSTFFDSPTGTTDTLVSGTTTPGSSTTTTDTTSTITGSTGSTTDTTVVTAPTSTAPYITSVINMPVTNSSTGAVEGAADKKFFFAQMSGTNSYVPPGPCNEFGCGGTIPLAYTTIGNDVVFFVP